MRKILLGLIGLLFAIPSWATNSGPISSVTVAGLVAQNGTPTPNTPVAINTNNGVLKWGVVSKNLFDRNNATLSYYLSPTTGEPVSNGASAYVRYISVVPNTTYTVSLFYTHDGYYTRVHSYAQNKSWNGLIWQQSNNDGATETTISHTFTTGANDYYLGISYGKANTNIQLEFGSTATSYVPYQEGIYTDGEVETITDSANHTATVATLLGVGDYRDTQNINTGAITRNVGVKVLDGTENWGYSYIDFWSTPSSEIKSSGGKIYCTHFKSVDSLPATGFRKDTCWAVGNKISLGLHYGEYEDIDTFKQYLADQYAAGTPVMIVYPLETATTESVAGQTMTTAPVNNRTGGVTGMTITTLLSSGASVVTTIANNAIKIATTAYNSARFSPVVTELNNTIATIRSVVTNTINQTKAIADLQAKKQTRPDEQCPAGKKCLLVEDNDGTPHWYEIIENAD